MRNQFRRTTRETTVTVTLGELAARGLADVRVDTGLPFYDHMLSTLLKYAGIQATVEASGDLRHHIMEDVAIVVGEAVRACMPAECARYGGRTIPMDDALVEATIDIGGRFYFDGGLPNRLYSHVLRSLAHALSATLHVRVLRGRDRHHVIEAAFKATGLAMREALCPSANGVFSTKGAAKLEREVLS